MRCENGTAEYLLLTALEAAFVTLNLSATEPLLT
jgi:hypothetical protein